MFEFRHGALHAESDPLEAIAREFGTPCYVYSRAAEVMLDGSRTQLVRASEPVEALFASEYVLR